jgi:hypothetical protein
MHVPPEVWGPFFWHTIHIAALGYPQEPTYSDKKAMKEFLESLQVIIPCPICRKHYASHLAKMPVSASIDSRNDVFRWTVELHNEVNVMLGKRKYTETEVIQYYTRLGARGKSPVVSSADFMEADNQAMLKGLAAGVAVTALVGGILWYNFPKKS